MSGGGGRGQFLYNIPSSVHWEFCRVMDGLSDLDWTRFASEVLGDQTCVRLAERRERRTDWVMNQWESRNGRVGELLDLLERLQLFRPRDLILCWASTMTSPAPAPACPSYPVSLSRFDPPPKSSVALPAPTTCALSTTVDKGGGRPLPRPAPPPSSLHSDLHRPPQASPALACGDKSNSGGVLCWPYDEVHAGTEGFSPNRWVGEGGFGIVYRASLRNTDCAVKRLKQDCSLDWTLVKQSFQTEVEKLSKFRHPNIVDLLGFCEGGGSVCLIYSYMENRSLEDQLHNELGTLSWSQRVGVVKEASAALQFLHSPPQGQAAVIHGDVKSSNILLDRHLVAKLADFGLARFACSGPSAHSPSRTATVGRTATVRGTLAYLPDEYVRNGELGTAVDVYSFGVVLLEVLTGRRALEKDAKSGEIFLKDLVGKVQDSPTGSSSAAWRKQLDERLIPGGAAEPAGCMEMVAVACRCLDKRRKRRPAMTEVFDKLQDIHNAVRKNHPCGPPASRSFPSPTSSPDPSVDALSHQLSTLGPLEHTSPPLRSSSSSFCSLTPPHPLHSSSSFPASSSSSSSSLPASCSASSSFNGPCETDESRGFSQYDLQSPGSTRPQIRSNGTGSRSLSPSARDQYRSPPGSTESQLSQPSVPSEDQYNFPPGPDSRWQTSSGFLGIPQSPADLLRSLSPQSSVLINPSKQHFLEKRAQYEEGKIQTPELLSLDDLYERRSSEELGGPEESDELDYLSATRE